MKALTIGAGVALIIGIFPESTLLYYFYLRWIIYVLAATVAFRFYQAKLIPWTLIFGSISVLFNPVIPLYLDKSAWVAIDLISAILFFMASASYKIKNTD